MLNQTINATSETLYKQWITVTITPEFIATLGVVWFLTLIIAILIGTIVRGRTSSGKLLDSRMIENPNFWYTILILFIELLFFILLIFPFHLKLFSLS